MTCRGRPCVEKQSGVYRHTLYDPVFARSLLYIENRVLILQVTDSFSVVSYIPLELRDASAASYNDGV